MTITGPIYSRGATNGANTVKSYNRFGYTNSKTISANQANLQSIKPEIKSDLFSVVIATTGGTSVIVSGVPNFCISVDNYTVVASGASSIKFLSGSNDITGNMSIGANGGVATNGGQVVKTNVNESLSIAATGSVAGHLSYRLI